MSRAAVQTASIFVDAYRELSYRKLFWITLIISLIVVAATACFGVYEKGITILWWEIEIGELAATLMTPKLFYTMIFVSFGISFWLAWGATILALVSTASIFPDFLTGGAIDLWLSKPISRFRLFLTKYILGLLFVALQVTIFTAASFLVLGLRGGVWSPSLFLAIPIVVCFFSYLFGFCVLFGVVTRSTIAALLLTMLVWFVLFLLNGADATLLSFVTVAEQRVEQTNKRIAIQRGRATPNEARLAQLETELGDQQNSAANIAMWHRMLVGVKTALPKTSETVELLSRHLISLEDMSGLEGPQERTPPGEDADIRWESHSVQMGVAEKLRERPVWWIVGTSLGFEALIVGLAAWVFCRRDY